MSGFVVHEFSFVVPGQPPSINRMYDVYHRFDGTGERVVGRSKAREVTVYQLVAMNVCQRAKPALWVPRETYQPRLGRGLIVIEQRFFLGRDIDCDNTQKALLDAIKFALGTQEKRTRKGSIEVVPIYDDNRFLGRAMSKQTGVKHPCVEVTIIG